MEKLRKNGYNLSYHTNEVLENMRLESKNSLSICTEYIEISPIDIKPGWVEYCDPFTGKCLFRMEMTNKRKNCQDLKQFLSTEDAGESSKKQHMKVISKSQCLQEKMLTSSISTTYIKSLQPLLWFLRREIKNLSECCDFSSPGHIFGNLTKLRMIMLRKYMGVKLFKKMITFETFEESLESDKSISDTRCNIGKNKLDYP